MGRLDLDALAGEPLIVELGGKEYRLELTVDDLVAIDGVQKSGAGAEGWELFRAIVKAAGMPGEVFRELNIEQVTSLVETINKHLLAGGVARIDRTVN